ncbi:uncharacterized protein [Prorops nasuta]|uniref:uncharacterized protein isoform X2 n=1 Tax=Prorops nasuta TaxID=863751 RepID=UPI0034D00E5E
MVRNVKVPVHEEQPQRIHVRSGACQPRDNLGVSCTIQTGDRPEDPRTGRKKACAMPPDNIGINGLPMQSTDKMQEIPEEPQYELISENSIADDSMPKNAPRRLKKKKTTRNKLGKTETVMNNMRLKGAGDLFYSSSSIISSTDSTVKERKIRRRRVPEYEPKDTKNLLNPELIKNEKKQLERKEKANKTSLEIGISNIRRPKHDPTKPRKPIIPRDNLGLFCRHLQGSNGRGIGHKQNANNKIKSQEAGAGVRRKETDVVQEIEEVVEKSESLQTEIS